MTKYADYLDTSVIFPNYEIKNTLGEVISIIKKQVRIAETEKYAHVTFLNGGREKPFQEKKEFSFLLQM